MQLIISNNSVPNPQSLDLTQYIMAAIEAGMDPASPTFSDKVFTHSLLKEGGTYTLENLQLKELSYPMLIGTGAAQSSASAQLIININQILATPGTTASWQDDGMTQPTYFNLASGQVDVQYNYRRGQAGYTQAKLRLFTQPFGTRPTTRFYARASGVGPILKISPFVSTLITGAAAIGATTQGGIAGFGGVQQASGGIFYAGNPSLAGDAPALLQLSYVAPVGPSAILEGLAPTWALSLLPDQAYVPLLTFPTGQLVAQSFFANGVNLHSADSVGSTYAEIRMPAGPGASSSGVQFTLDVTGGYVGVLPAKWAGNHRIFAIARASSSGPGQTTAFLTSQPNELVQFPVTASIPAPFDWQLYDLGTITFRASEVPVQPMTIIGIASQTASASLALDVTAFVMLPDANTWFFNPDNVQASQYGYPLQYDGGLFGQGPYSNTFLIDDLLPDQMMGWASGLTTAPLPGILGASAARITQYSRGIVPRPDPSVGIPILALLGVGQSFINPMQLSAFGLVNTVAGGSWANPQNRPAYAQINVLERSRYVLP